MRCPHCLTVVHLRWIESLLVEGQLIGNPPRQWKVSAALCPECRDSIIMIAGSGVAIAGNIERVVYPHAVSRPIPQEVEEPFRSQFREACDVIAISEKASAALGRRCLQNLLVSVAGVTKKDLYDQIEEVIPKLPAEIAESLHAVRNIGNFAAHPLKSKSTGQIIDVEPGEAEWILDALEELFDFYFVRPAAHAKRKATLNAKLADLGKPPI